MQATLEANDVDLYYRVIGSGPPLLLLHGFFSTAAQWKPYIDDLVRDFQLIIPDLRGHGRSTNPSGVFTYRQSAFDILALLDHLNVTNCCGVGYSAGGIALLHMAIQQPDRIKAMSLWSTTYYLADQARAVMHALTMERITQDMPKWLKWLKDNHVNTDDQVEALVSQFHAIADSKDALTLTVEQLAAIKAKTLILLGDRDSYFPVNIAVDMYQAIPNSSLWILPNTGHLNIFEKLRQGSVSDDIRTESLPRPVRQFLMDALL